MKIHIQNFDELKKLKVLKNDDLWKSKFKKLKI